MLSPNNQPHQGEPLTFPAAQAALLTPYLPPPPPPSAAAGTPRDEDEAPASSTHPAAVHVTLTYAHSLDASIALAPGARTALSGPASKAMTHYLRARHDAILVGAGTAVADDPGLNSRLLSVPVLSRSPPGPVQQEEEEEEEEGEHGGGPGAGGVGAQRVRQPRPVVLDPRGRVIRTAREGMGLAPLVLVGHPAAVVEERRRVLEAVGGRYVVLEPRAAGGRRFDWADVLAVLRREGLRSVMIEGGAEVINSLLAPPGNALVDSVIVTIAPTWLGQGGVVVSPPRTAAEDGTAAPPVRLTDVKWCPLGEDVVLCGRIRR
ncbi:322e538e-b8f9-4ba2-80ec-8c594fab6b9d [Thermothielavioides terrestris]|uniref:2,5-diamino-6-ribosylamino-4(3H)-pyrimidinone 5'-phosphate reductase n=1 Tax=Thermothielavioides terrestris TaxID=2587410 RepID=A0A446BM34_9PEZI|nr:322e538e-b8f9-4ba2-80ec-8c594fab6b9d [Thermothielavioides terrestris]